ncbi:hypothetical protein [Mariniflexile rhizosphaerae]|uniref:hypothetical protein n=1 Tax=unclassified Mariniflexile TaxID=2643887 RepID=UPI000E3D5285|nr:hypothetical protein [Mariniflexile sp. TRM1-10]
MNQKPEMIWKFDKDGNERPLQEQLDRRKADLEIAFMHLEWSEKNPLRLDQLKQKIHQQNTQKHLNKIKSDISTLEKKINQSITATN